MGWTRFSGVLGWNFFPTVLMVTCFARIIMLHTGMSQVELWSVKESMESTNVNFPDWSWSAGMPGATLGNVDAEGPELLCAILFFSDICIDNNLSLSI